MACGLATARGTKSLILSKLSGSEIYLSMTIEFAKTKHFLSPILQTQYHRRESKII
jgi:hypothetical protein